MTRASPLTITKRARNATRFLSRVFRLAAKPSLYGGGIVPSFLFSLSSLLSFSSCMRKGPRLKIRWFSRAYPDFELTFILAMRRNEEKCATKSRRVAQHGVVNHHEIFLCEECGDGFFGFLTRKNARGSTLRNLHCSARTKLYLVRRKYSTKRLQFVSDELAAGGLLRWDDEGPPRGRICIYPNTGYMRAIFSFGSASRAVSCVEPTSAV